MHKVRVVRVMLRDRCKKITHEKKILSISKLLYVPGAVPSNIDPVQFDRIMTNSTEITPSKFTCVPSKSISRIRSEFGLFQLRTDLGSRNRRMSPTFSKPRWRLWDRMRLLASDMCGFYDDTGYVSRQIWLYHGGDLIRGLRFPSRITTIKWRRSSQGLDSVWLSGEPISFLDAKTVSNGLLQYMMYVTALVI